MNIRFGRNAYCYAAAASGASRQSVSQAGSQPRCESVRLSGSSIVVPGGSKANAIDRHASRIPSQSNGFEESGIWAWERMRPIEGDVRRLWAFQWNINGGGGPSRRRWAIATLLEGLLKCARRARCDTRPMQTKMS